MRPTSILVRPTRHTRPLGYAIRQTRWARDVPRLNRILSGSLRPLGGVPLPKKNPAWRLRRRGGQGPRRPRRRLGHTIVRGWWRLCPRSLTLDPEKGHRVGVPQMSFSACSHRQGRFRANNSLRVSMFLGSHLVFLGGRAVACRAAPALRRCVLGPPR